MANWWEAAGVTPVAAYAAIGAADLASSYVNLANPGTFNAAPGVAPAWDVMNGWAFNGTTQYLDTGIAPPSNTYSVLVRFSGAPANSAGRLFGYSGASAIMYITPGASSQVRYAHAAVVNVAPSLAAAVLGLTPTSGYRNGVAEAAMSGYSGANARNIYLAALNSGVAGSFWPGSIQAVAIFAAALNDTQMLAISNAMSALVGAVTGQLAATLAPAQLTAAAQLQITGQLTATLAPATLVSAGQVRIAGQLTAQLAAATLVAAGQGQQPAHGQLAVVLMAATLTATNVRVAIELGTVYGQADTATIYGQQTYGEVIGI